MEKIKEIINQYRYEVFFIALLFQLLYPFISTLLIIDIVSIRLIVFSILVIVSFTLAKRKLPRFLVIILGMISAVGMWCHYVSFTNGLLQYFRIYATCFFYMTLVYILTRNFLIADKINLKVVIGAMSGYLLIGYLGAITIEMMEFHHPESFNIQNPESFDYTYFSFVSMLTVGYGDIIPTTPSAKSLTVLISLVGQFYMAIGIASFVGKFMNK